MNKKNQRNKEEPKPSETTNVEKVDDIRSDLITIQNKIEKFEKGRGHDIDTEYHELMEEVIAFTGKLVQSQSDIVGELGKRCSRAKQSRSLKQLGY